MLLVGVTLVMRLPRTPSTLVTMVLPYHIGVGYVLWLVSRLLNDMGMNWLGWVCTVWASVLTLRVKSLVPTTLPSLMTDILLLTRYRLSMQVLHLLFVSVWLNWMVVLWQCLVRLGWCLMADWLTLVWACRTPGLNCVLPLIGARMLTPFVLYIGLLLITNTWHLHLTCMCPRMSRVLDMFLVCTDL